MKFNELLTTGSQKKKNKFVYLLLFFLSKRSDKGGLISEIILNLLTKDTRSLSYVKMNKFFTHKVNNLVILHLLLEME